MKPIANKHLIYSLILICLNLVALNVSAQSVTALKPIFQRSYDQWVLSDSVRVYNAENLYDYIDGAADSYISYNFQELLVTTYNGKDGNYMTVEIYQHQLPIHAFGIYAQERPLHGKFSKIGAQSYQETGILNFLCNRYYIKISSHDESLATSAIMNKLALDLANKLDGDAQMPKSLGYLPAEGKVENSESFINTNFLGYAFLHSVLVANYKKANHSFKVFIIFSPSIENAKSTMVKFMDIVKNPFNGNEGQFPVMDPHNGKMLIEWKGKFIWGILNETDAQTNNDYLKLIREGLLKAKEI